MSSRRMCFVFRLIKEANRAKEKTCLLRKDRNEDLDVVTCKSHERRKLDERNESQLKDKE